MTQILIDNLQSIDQAAARFVAAMGNARIFAFYGAMGAGKTTFIKAVCQQLGVGDTVNSPTFAIVNEYVDECGDSIYHFDFYRIETPQEALDIGYEDYVQSGFLCFMEWPERIGSLLPSDAVRVTIDEQPDGSRCITF